MGSRARSPLRPIDWIIVVLAGATGLIHLFLGFSQLGSSSDLLLPVSFILNGLAYFGLILALYFLSAFRRYHNLLEWVLIALAATTIILYFYFNGAAGLSSPLGMATKGIELLLIVVIAYDLGH